jgi:hypothetical protein
MLYREDPQGRIVITQPAHAWLSGQLARAWGNDQFGAVAPREEVCLGAEQHDVGHTAWERAPTLNPQTGLPFSFFELPRHEHVRLWSGAARMVLPQGRYAALLVSLHGTGLYEHYDAATESPENAEIVQDYLTQERAFQEEILTSLRADSHYRPYAAEEVVARNRRLLQIWDALSLALCFGGWRTRSVPQVPAATGTTTLILHAHDADPTRILVVPWPFQGEHVTLVYEGRRLPETFSTESLMREALNRARWVTLQISLFPGEQA